MTTLASLILFILQLPYLCLSTPPQATNGFDVALETGRELERPKGMMTG